MLYLGVQPAKLQQLCTKCGGWQGTSPAQPGRQSCPRVAVHQAEAGRAQPSLMHLHAVENLNTCCV